MRIVVTKNDIALAKEAVKQGEMFSMSCPISQSLKRRFPGKTIFTGGQVCGIGKKSCSLPEKARAFIDHFDSNWQSDMIDPIQFDIDYVPNK